MHITSSIDSRDFWVSSSAKAIPAFWFIPMYRSPGFILVFLFPPKRNADGNVNIQIT